MSVFQRYGHRVSDIALVTVTFNSESVIADFAATAADFAHVYVVDNASGDATLEKVRTLIPHAQIIDSAENLGFSAANQLGFDAAQRAQLPYVLFLNPDAVMDAASVGVLRTTLQQRTDAAIVCPKVIDGGVDVPTVMRWDYRQPYERMKTQRIALQGAPDILENICINGACFLVNANYFGKVGAFTTDLFLFWEEDDISLRIARGGYAILFHQGAVAHHIGGGSTPKSLRVTLRKLYSYKWSKLYLNRKYVSGTASVLESLKLVLIGPVGLVFSLLFFKKKSAARWLAWWAAGIDGLFLTKFFRKYF